MMRKVLMGFVAAVMAVMTIVPHALAEERGSRQEAKAMAESAAAFVAEKGVTAAFSAFDTGTDGFSDKDLYVFAYDRAGTCVAHGANKALIGKNLLSVKDVDGKALIADIVAVQTAAWIDYKWHNPRTRAIETKHAYIVRTGDVVVGVGAYGQ